MATLRSTTNRSLQRRLGREAVEWRTTPDSPAKRYLFRQGLAHLVQAEELPAATSLAGDFEYQLERRRSEGVEDVERWVNDMDLLAERSPIHAMRCWSDFARVHRHHFRRAGWQPWRVLFQAAMDHADDSPVTRGAERFEVSGHRDWAWVRWLNRPRTWAPNPLLATFAGHEEGVKGAQTLENGRLLSWDENSLRVWRLGSGRPLAVLRPPRGTVEGVVVLPNNRAVSWGGRTLYLWDLESGSLRASLEGHDGAVQGATCLPDGDVLSYAADHTLRTWNAETGELRAVFQGHTGIIHGVRPMPGRRVLSFSRDGTLRLWDAVSGLPLAVMQGPSTGVTGAELLPGGEVVSFGRENALRLWDGNTGTALGVLERHTDWINGVLPLTGGQFLSYARDHTLRTWDVDTGEQLAVLSGHTAQVRHALLLAGNRVLSWGMDPERMHGHQRLVDNTLRIWDATTGASTAVLRGPARAVGGVLELQGNRIASYSDQEINIWDAHTGDILAALPGHSDAISGFQALPGERLLSWSRDGALCLWSVDAATLRGQQAESQPSAFFAKRWAEDRFVSLGDDSLDLWDASGRRLDSISVEGAEVVGIAPLDDDRVGLLSSDNSLQILSFRSGSAMGRVPGERGQPRGMTSFTGQTLVAWDARLFSWDGREPTLLDAERITDVMPVSSDRFASCAMTGTIRLWRKATLEPCATLVGHDDEVLGVTLIAGERVLSWSADRTLRTWDATSGMLLATLSGHLEAVTGATVLKDGRIVSWSADPRDRDVRVWDGDTGRALCVLPGHEGDVHGCLALPGERLLSWSEDGTLKSWSVESGRMLHRFEGHTCAVVEARVLPDGRLVSFSSDGTLRLWDADNGKQVGMIASPSDWTLHPELAAEAATWRMLHHCLDVPLVHVRDAELTGDVDGDVLATVIGQRMRICSFVG